MLDPPYPNPAADRAVLRFAAKPAAGASLDLYDVRGRLVKHLADVRGDGVVRTLEWSRRSWPAAPTSRSCAPAASASRRNW